MTPAVVQLSPFLASQRVFDLAVPDWWVWLCSSAGIDATIVVGPVEARRGTIRIDGRFLGLEPHDLAELDEHDGVLALETEGTGEADLVIGAGVTSRSQLGGPVRTHRYITIRRALTAVEDPQTLAEAEEQLRQRKVAALARSGVRVMDPARTWVSPTVQVEPGARLWPDVTLLGWSVIGAQAELGVGVHLTDCVVGADARIKPYTVGDRAHIGAGARVGPFAHLRPGTRLGDDVHVGNFVETKNAHLEAGAKANHLTYLGDCEVGEGANVGAGTITCNYDGARKHRTVIGAGAFIGTHTSLVAPVTVGAGALVAAGSVITADVPDEALAVARAAQVTVEAKGARVLARNRALKAAEAALRPVTEAVADVPVVLSSALIEAIDGAVAEEDADAPAGPLDGTLVPMDARIGLPMYDPPTQEEEPG